MQLWPYTLAHASSFGVTENSQPVQSEALDHMIIMGEASLRHILHQYLAHYHTERNHQGLDNQLIEPEAEVVDRASQVEHRERFCW